MFRLDTVSHSNRGRLPAVSILAIALVCIVFCAIGATPSLNDTGITYAGGFPAGIRATCEAAQDATTGLLDERDRALILAQDCASGADVSIGKGAAAAFRYRKIGANGESLEDDADAWHCVHDLTSGLMWEVKSQSAQRPLHRVEDRFTWYNSAPSENGGDIGNWNADGDSCAGYSQGQPRSFCHIEQFASRVNRQGLCGSADWRVPTRAELTSLVHFGRFQPAIETRYFPFALSTFYWTVNAPPARPLEAWTVDFEFGTTGTMRKTDLRPVRLVRTVARP